METSTCKNIKTFIVAATLFLAVTGAGLAATGHSHHACAPDSHKKMGTKPYRVGYNAEGQIICLTGPSKGNVAPGY